MEGQNALFIGFTLACIAVVVWTVFKKKKTAKSKAALLAEIKSNHGFEVKELALMPIATIRKNYTAILNAYVAILREYVEDEMTSDEDILSAIDDELKDINLVNNEAKKELIYDIFVTAGCKIELKIFIPVIAKMALRLSQEDDMLNDVNAVYIFFSDVVMFSEDFNAETFAEDCLWSMENIVPTNLKKEAEEILNDFTAVIIESLKNKKVGG